MKFFVTREGWVARILITGSLLVLASGCNPFPNFMSKPAQGYTALHRESCRGDYEAVQRLLRQGYSANDRFWYFKRYDGGNAANQFFDCQIADDRKAPRPIDWPLLRQLVSSGADLNVANRELLGWPPLTVAVSMYWHPEQSALIDFLLAHGATFEPAEVNWRNRPLVLAVSFALDLPGQLAIADKLLKAGARMDSESLSKLLFQTERNFGCEQAVPSDLVEKRLANAKSALSFLMSNGMTVDTYSLQVADRSCVSSPDGAGKRTYSGPSLLGEFVRRHYPSNIVESKRG